MLPLQFFGQDIHFVIGLFAALVFFAVFWLYFDAWSVKRKTKDIFRWAGFLLISLSFLVYATTIEKSLLNSSSISNVSQALSQVLRISGYIAILIGECIDPLQNIPVVKDLAEELRKKNTAKLTLQDQKNFEEGAPESTVIKQVASVPSTSLSESDGEQAPVNRSQNMAFSGFGALVNSLYFLLPLGACAVSVMYWRRATKGLERHLKPMAIAFITLTGFEILSLSNLWSNSTNPTISRLVAPFGPIWITNNILLLAVALLVGKWVWQYLTKRFVSQLFMIFVSVVLGTFLITTVCFTYLLLNNVQQSALNNLNTAANVLKYAMNTKDAETLADSETVAENPSVINAVATSNHSQLVDLTNSFLYSKGVSSLIITNNNAEVLLRAENPDSYGDSLSSDSLIRRALIGENASSINTESGILAPTVYIRSATPIRNAQQQIVGAAVVSFMIDNSFVASIKQSTGLDSSIYANNTISATTFLAPDGVTKWTGVKENNKSLDATVLTHGRTYKGTASILNQQYLGVYLPLKNIDNSVVGMLFIGQSSLSILKTANHSIELTFAITAILLVLSIIPAYVIAKRIARQLE